MHGSFITLFRLFPKSQGLLGALVVYAFGYPQTGRMPPFGFSLSVLNLFFLPPKKKAEHQEAETATQGGFDLLTFTFQL